MPPSGPRRARARRLARAFFHVSGALAVAFAGYVGLVKIGALANPFGPSLAGDVEAVRSDRPGLRILFVGNSLTYSNSMPALVHGLAEEDPGAPPVFAVAYTKGGWTLREASEDDRLAELLGDVRWDVVVLQENSRQASLAPIQPQEMFPFARALDRKIAVAGARTMLFVTWGYERGAPVDDPAESYSAMQARIVNAYSALADQISAESAAVGPAWAEALRRSPGLELWADDGMHPSLAGSYLAACVLYAKSSGRDPTQSAFTGGLDPLEARFLQRVAADVVGT